VASFLALNDKEMTTSTISGVRYATLPYTTTSTPGVITYFVPAFPPAGYTNSSANLESFVQAIPGTGTLSVSGSPEGAKVRHLPDLWLRRRPAGDHHLGGSGRGGQ
jgi:hypothetical protein